MSLAAAVDMDGLAEIRSVADEVTPFMVTTGKRMEIRVFVGSIASVEESHPLSTTVNKLSLA